MSSWLYIPAEVGERIETICNQHFNPHRDPCNYSNDLDKSAEENTRIFEYGMAAALDALNSSKGNM